MVWMNRNLKLQSLVILGYVLIVIGVYLFVDQPLAWYLHALALGKHYPMLNWVSVLGESAIYLFILPCVALFFRMVKRSKQNELRMWFLWGMLLVTSSITVLLKYLLGRARPGLLFHQDIFGFFGWHLKNHYHSFPSGHTTLAMTVILGLAWTYPRFQGLAIVVGAVILASRVLLTHHYLSDILGTIVLVMVEVHLLSFMLQRLCPMYWKRLK